MNRRDVLKLGLAASASALAAPRAFAQAAFPSRPIKLVVPFSAGGVNDIVGRQWAERMKPLLGSVYRREPRRRRRHARRHGGQARPIPTATPSLLGSTSTMVLNTMTPSKVAYDPVKDFVPIAIFCVSTTSIAVHPSVPAKNVKELIAYVKANTGKLSYGSAGTGTMSHLSGELFKQLAPDHRRGARALQGRRTRHRRPGQRPHPDHVAEHHRPGAGIPQDRQDPHPARSTRRRGSRPRRTFRPPSSRACRTWSGSFSSASTRRPTRRKLAVDAHIRRDAGRRWRQPGIREGPDRFRLRDRCSYFTADAALQVHGRGVSTRWKPVVDAIGLKTN